MSDWAGAFLCVVIVLAVFSTWGERDLIDATVDYIDRKEQCADQPTTNGRRE